MTNLPPEDRPDFHLEPVEDDEIPQLGSGALDDPMTTAETFFSLLFEDPSDPQRLADLRLIVTPESLDAWGDFAWAVELLDGTGLASNIAWPVEGPSSGVAYAKFFTNNGQSSVVRSSEPEIIVMARAVATMQYRPSRGYWMIHGLGDYMSPDQLPIVT